MKKYGEVDIQLHTFLSSTLVGSNWSVSRPGRFISSDRASVLFEYGAESAIGQVWSLVKRNIS